ncbi:hypothetical protein DSM112329_04785 [Paraconexibacter sp. AEG42_29]|uniref:FCP1 homology domain-containing protein n=1 Tax=Paraconexibacter sp. AEG42_29 TaxID=2997339 RepID=A0AAU7B1Y4_9ACTN
MSTTPPLVHFPDGTVRPLIAGPTSLPAPLPAGDRPLLLLDLDGVLLPFAARPDDIEHRLRGELSLRFRPDTPRLLRELGRDFDLVWATMWEHRANTVVAPLLGLPPLPVISFDDRVPAHRTLKLPAVRRQVGDRALAWIDDSLGADAHAWPSIVRRPHCCSTSSRPTASSRVTPRSSRRSPAAS